VAIRRPPPRTLAKLGVLGTLGVASLLLAPAPTRGSASTTPIQHVVIIYLENHTFDNLLGDFCVINSRCNGQLTGTVSSGQVIPLSQGPDIPPAVGHDHNSQVIAIDHGKMDHFDKLPGCSAPAYACYAYYAPSQIPNITTLASSFALSDATFQLDQTASWGSHLELVTSTQDGFFGNNPNAAALIPGTTAGPGWGCDSNRESLWKSSPTARPILVPTCVPFADGTGAGGPTPVKWVPTLMDAMDTAGLSYSIDAGDPINSPTQPFQKSGYQWAICPTFADCLETSQKSHLHLASQIIADAQAGTLPAVSIVTPNTRNSQHNGNSMLLGDNWLGTVMSALEHGSQWNQTAVFVAWDDCGCFYDHVGPPGASLGPRIPVLIVSPYARPAYTDSTMATQASFLAYIEHNFSLPALGTNDAAAYPYTNAFNYAQLPRGPATMVQSPVPLSSLTAPVVPDPSGT
jgi:phospholipase C